MPCHPIRLSARFALAGLILPVGVTPLRAAAPTLSSAPVLLWTGGAPGAKDNAAKDKPAIYPFLPAANKNTGAAILIIAGVASASRTDGGEGPQMARWLNERGIAAFVLRHRPLSDDRDSAFADVNRAVQYLRAHAADFKISPTRVATLGFGPGAELAAEVTYNHQLEAHAESADPVERFSGRPNLLALIWGSALPQGSGPPPPPTFLVGSTATSDGMSGMIDLWTKLRAARAPVDAHFFAHADVNAGLATDNPSLGSWPESFHAWARFQGLLTDERRVPLKGMAYLDGRALPHGYVIFTPIDFVGAGPVVGRVINSTANLPIGEFSVPANQGPVAGRYKVDVRQNMNRWLSNSFTGELVNARSGATPDQAYFGHHRVLAPSIDDQHSFTKVHPSDPVDYIVEIKPEADANLALKIEVFSK